MPYDIITQLFFTLAKKYFFKNGSVLKSDNPKTIVKNFSAMEQASDILFHKLDAMVQEYDKK